MRHAFSGEEYEAQVRTVGERLRSQVQARVEALREQAQAHGLDVIETAQGTMIAAVGPDGTPTTDHTESKEQRATRIETGQHFADQLADIKRWAIKERAVAAVQLDQLNRQGRRPGRGAADRGRDRRVRRPCRHRGLAVRDARRRDRESRAVPRTARGCCRTARAARAALLGESAGRQCQPAASAGRARGQSDLRERVRPDRVSPDRRRRAAHRLHAGARRLAAPRQRRHLRRPRRGDGAQTRRPGNSSRPRCATARSASRSRTASA